MTGSSKKDEEWSHPFKGGLALIKEKIRQSHLRCTGEKEWMSDLIQIKEVKKDSWNPKITG